MSLWLCGRHFCTNKSVTWKVAFVVSCSGDQCGVRPGLGAGSATHEVSFALNLRAPERGQKEHEGRDMFLRAVGSWVTFCPIFELSLSQCELAWVLIGPPVLVESRLQGKSPGEATGAQKWGGGIFFFFNILILSHSKHENNFMSQIFLFFPSFLFFHQPRIPPYSSTSPSSPTLQSPYYCPYP